MPAEPRSIVLSPPAATTAVPFDLRTRIETVLATVFGLIFLGLAVIVTIETAARKLFNVSLQGADELGGYALAVGSTIAFSLALLGRNHIRVDVFHEKFSARVQALLNWISIVRSSPPGPAPGCCSHRPAVRCMRGSPACRR
ncbi:MAG TPA: TRAP transporter small permease [Albitalea sp.]|nr:TRAP transporter small permease [Albitalea sp.]